MWIDKAVFVLVMLEQATVGSGDPDAPLKPHDLFDCPCFNDIVTDTNRWQQTAMRLVECYSRFALKQYIGARSARCVEVAAPYSNAPINIKRYYHFYKFLFAKTDAFCRPFYYIYYIILYFIQYISVAKIY